MEDDSRVLRVTEVAREYRVGRMTVLRRLNEGELKGHKAKGVWLVQRSDADCYFLGQCAATT
jgi:DNA invertase Pin-like site-specific DNA recombinase